LLTLLRTRSSHLIVTMRDLAKLDEHSKK